MNPQICALVVRDTEKKENDTERRLWNGTNRLGLTERPLLTIPYKFTMDLTGSLHDTVL